MFYSIDTRRRKRSLSVSQSANRYQAAIQDLIGFFVNTLVLRTNLSGDFTFSQLLSRVRDDCREAYAHQDLSFEKLV